jgi:hypothetical protein
MTENLRQSFESLRAHIAAQALPELGEDVLEPLYEELLVLHACLALERGSRCSQASESRNLLAQNEHCDGANLRSCPDDWDDRDFYRRFSMID